MFQRTEINFKREEIKTFIETPSQNLSAEQISQGAKNLADYINLSNEQFITHILVNHDYIATSFLFLDLSVKMQSQVQSVQLLFDTCQTKLLENSLWNAFDLERFAKAIPSRTEAIAEFIKADENILQRILESLENEPEVFERIKQYPALRFESEPLLDSSNRCN